MLSNVPKEVSHEVSLSFAIADEIIFLMQKRGLSKKQLADALGKRPSEVTKWLSGQHNFTIRTISMLANFFGEPIIQIASHGYMLPDDHKSSMVAEDGVSLYK